MSLTLEDTVTEPAAPIVPISAHDRCDKCGSQAYVRFGMSGLDLLFCSHHSNKFEVKLTNDGFNIIQDERTLLNVKRESSAA